MLQKLIMFWLRMATYWPLTGLVELRPKRFVIEWSCSEYPCKEDLQCCTFMDMSPPLPSLSSPTTASASYSLTKATTSGWSTSEATSTPGTTLWAPMPNIFQSLDPDHINGHFWNFTWWEMGTMVCSSPWKDLTTWLFPQDLPSVMRYVISTTNSNKRYFVS